MGDRRDSYRGFAKHYDLYQWDWFAHSSGSALIGLLDERGLKGGRLLDAGCGTGTLSIALAAHGYRVTGIDLSEAMLEAARRKDKAGSVRWRTADITRFDLPGGEDPFDVVVCVTDTLNHLETLDEWEAAFRRFAACLRPGGRLFFDAVTCYGLENLNKFAMDDVCDQTMILGAIYEPAARRSTVRVTLFVPAEGKRLYEKITETITEWGQPVKGIFERLERAGFGEIERPWSKALDPEKEPRLQVLAVRR